jgi:hypothetical protein
LQDTVSSCCCAIEGPANSSRCAVVAAPVSQLQ